MVLIRISLIKEVLLDELKNTSLKSLLNRNSTCNMIPVFTTESHRKSVNHNCELFSSY